MPVQSFDWPVKDDLSTDERVLARYPPDTSRDPVCPSGPETLGDKETAPVIVDITKFIRQPAACDLWHYARGEKRKELLWFGTLWRMGKAGVPDPSSSAMLPRGAYYALTVLTALNVINVWHRYLIVSALSPSPPCFYLSYLPPLSPLCLLSW